MERHIKWNIKHNHYLHVLLCICCVSDSFGSSATAFPSSDWLSSLNVENGRSVVLWINIITLKWSYNTVNKSVKTVILKSECVLPAGVRVWLLLHGSVWWKLFHYTCSRPTQAQNPKEQEPVKLSISHNSFDEV